MSFSLVYIFVNASNINTQVTTWIILIPTGSQKLN